MKPTEIHELFGLGLDSVTMEPGVSFMFGGDIPKFLFVTVTVNVSSVATVIS